MQIFTHRDTEIEYIADYTDNPSDRFDKVRLRTNRQVRIGEVFLVVDLDVSVRWILQEAQPLADKIAPIEEIREAVARGLFCFYYLCTSSIYHPKTNGNLFAWWEVMGDTIPATASKGTQSSAER